MHADIAEKRQDLIALCRRYGVERLEVFGSAARGADFDPTRSDADFLVTFSPQSPRRSFPPSPISRRDLEALLGRPIDLDGARRDQDEPQLHPAPPEYCRPRPRQSIELEAQADRDTALLLNMLLAARDARAFIAGLSEAAFVAGRLHQSAVIQSCGDHRRGGGQGLAGPSRRAARHPLA